MGDFVVNFVYVVVPVSGAAVVVAFVVRAMVGLVVVAEVEVGVFSVEICIGRSIFTLHHKYYRKVSIDMYVIYLDSLRPCMFVSLFPSF